FAGEAFGKFLHEVSQEFFRSDRLCMIRTEFAGKTIAVGLNFRGGKVTYAYQVGIDPESLAENPGWLVHAALIQHAIATGQSGIDFLRGDEPYKAHLRAQPRPCKEIRVVPSRLRSQLWHAAWRTGTTVKDLLKTSLTLVGIRDGKEAV